MKITKVGSSLVQNGQAVAVYAEAVRSQMSVATVDPANWNDILVPDAGTAPFFKDIPPGLPVIWRNSGLYFQSLALSFIVKNIDAANSVRIGTNPSFVAGAENGFLLDPGDSLTVENFQHNDAAHLRAVSNAAPNCRLCIFLIESVVINFWGA